MNLAIFVWTIGDVIGLGLIALIILVVTFFKSAIWIERRIKYLKTRNIPPRKGQEWDQDGEILTIGERYPKGHFSVEHRFLGSFSRASWGQTDEEWRERVKNRKLFLVRNPNGNQGAES